MWYPLASVLVAWAPIPPQDWLHVRGTPNTVERALPVVWETLEKPSAMAAAVGVAWCFFQLRKLRQRLHFTLQQSYANSEEGRKPWRPGSAPWRRTSEQRSLGDAPPRPSSPVGEQVGGTEFPAGPPSSDVKRKSPPQPLAPGGNRVGPTQTVEHYLWPLYAGQASRAEETVSAVGGGALDSVAPPPLGLRGR